MKKRILISIGALIIILGTIYLAYFLNTKRAITSDKFIEIIEKEKFKAYNVTNQFGEDHVKNATVAYNEKLGYQLEFIVFNNNDSAKNAFNLNKKTFEQNKKEIDKLESSSNNKYSVYSLTTNDKFMYISRINNTLIYVNIDGSFKTDGIKLINKLGY